MADEHKYLYITVVAETPRLGRVARVDELIRYIITLTNMSSARVRNVNLICTFDRMVVWNQENSTPGWEPQVGLLGAPYDILGMYYPAGDIFPWSSQTFIIAAQPVDVGRLSNTVAARGEVEVAESPDPIEVTSVPEIADVDLVEASTPDAVMRVYDENPGTISVNYRLWKSKLIKQRG
ncbi:hypothetical protein [Clostridium paridis]|uniref:DUF11 domain-containing protein n=1 Tax=Clostridium paridis TaxID=2803863 RepID=A0A937K4Y2_9CLOT|nr:hypothetical protein [Clostridium paridis]MBL4933147.1 hypothetical protein [Clostridium paridis]